MKICVVGDIHWAETSSLIKGRGIKYSKKLENLIKSINWAEEQASIEKCDLVIYLGDFFDKPTLTSEEITALKELKFSPIKHKLIVGNHEADTMTLNFSSAFVLLKDNFEIINTVNQEDIDEQTTLLYIPYIVEENRKPLTEYIKPHKNNLIAFSHNDLKNLQYGNYISKEGFDVKEIHDNCNIYINGHIHNCSVISKQISKYILNLGILSGKNFSEDASKCLHNIAIVDTNTMAIELLINPYAFNFYKLEINKEEDLSKFNHLENNAVISVRCENSLVNKVKEIIKNHDNIVESRVSIFYDNVNTENHPQLHLDDVSFWVKFFNFIFATLTDLKEEGISTEIVKEELSAIMPK